MQHRPTAPELLDAIAELLDVEVMPVVPIAMQHKIRVAGNLARILGRELRLGPGGDERERALLGALLGAEGDTRELTDEVVDRLSRDAEQGFERDAWAVLVEVARADLAIAKPGYDDWEGA